MGVVISFNQFQNYPEYFQRTIHKPVYIHKSFNLFFRLDYDNSIAPSGYPRFVEGCQFFCKRCGEPAFSVFRYVERFKCFVTMKVFCKFGCGRLWLYSDDEMFTETLEKI